MEPKINWISLIGAMFVMFVNNGYLQTYGLMYLELLDKYNEGPQKTGIATTIFAVFIGLSSLPAGILIDRLGAWFVLLLAGLLGAVGSIIAAFSSTITLIYISLGVIVACATSGSFVSATSGVTLSFSSHRSLALGLLFAGGSLGTMFYPLIFAGLVSLYTLRGVLMFLAGFFLNNLVVACLFYAARPAKLRKSQEQHVHINRETSNMGENCPLSMSLDPNLEISDIEIPERVSMSHKVKEFITAFFTLECLSIYLWYLTYVFALFGYLMYFPPYNRELLITKFQQATLLSIFGAADLLSRIMTGFLGGISCVNIYYLTSINMTIVGVITILLPTFVLIGDSVYVILIVHMAVMGLMVGGLQAFLGSFVVDSVGTDKSGTALGILSVCFGIAMGIPPNIYGPLKGSSGTYVWVPYLSGASFLISAVVILLGQIPRLRSRLCSHKPENL